MIDAFVARALSRETGAEAAAMLTQIEPRVKEAAAAGKSNVFFFLDAAEANTPLRTLVTPLHNQVMDKLYALGYRVQFVWSAGSYVPCGLSDDEGNGPAYSNYGLAIHW
jgi:hypothetical protein